MQPFTYLIGWSHLDRWYYGVRYRKGCHPGQLWTTYFTSSIPVKGFIEEHGQPDVVEVRRLFSTADEARNWETGVLKRMGVLHDERWLNRSVAKAIKRRDTTPWNKGKKGTYKLEKGSPFKGVKRGPMSDEAKANMGKAHVGREFWNDGISEKRTRTHPGEGWVRGRLPFKQCAIEFKGIEYDSIAHAHRMTGHCYATIIRHPSFRKRQPSHAPS